MCAFKRGSDPRAALDLFGRVVHDGLGDGKDVAESGRHVKWWLVVMKKWWWAWMMVMVRVQVASRLGFPFYPCC